MVKNTKPSLDHSNTKPTDMRALIFLLLVPFAAYTQPYPVHFKVDMNGFTGGSYNQVFLNGNFNSWCGNCMPMSDPDQNGVYETTLYMPAGTIEYKFTLDGWSQVETFQQGMPCTLTTGQYTNRVVSISGPTTLPTVCWGSCSACTTAEPANTPVCNCDFPTYFAGRKWTVKEYEAYTWGPGDNYFSARPEDVFVDENGFLHLRLAEHNGKWFSTEVISEDTMGYGVYTFVVEGDLEQLPANTVLGLFTWDNNTLVSAGNSELDVEVARWGDASLTDYLQFSVQPVWFGGYYPERTLRVPTAPGALNGVTAHRIFWSDTLIVWHSWKGRADGPDLLGTWSFNLNNPARVKIENGITSDPIVIPAPGNTTHARINFWMLNGGPPSDGQEHEIVIRNFSYEPF